MAGGAPQCMSQYGRTLGTARVPTAVTDELRCYPASPHIAVLRGGRVFAVDVLSSDGAFLSPQELHSKVGGL